MDKLVDWKRRKIRERHWIHLGLAAAILLGTPLVVALVAACWRLAFVAVL